LDFSLIRQTRDVVGAEVKQVNEFSTSYTLEFNIFEENDGAEFQILYLGDPHIQYEISGVIEGAKKIKVVHSGYEYSGSTVTKYIGLRIGKYY
jgi:hypothetical protein